MSGSPPPQRFDADVLAQRQAGSRGLILLMLIAVTTVTALAFWDEQRESAAALDDFAQEQTALAASVAAELGTRLAAVRRDAGVIAESLEEGRRVPGTAADGYISYVLRKIDSPPAQHNDAAISLRLPTAGGRSLDLLVPAIKLLEGSARIERPELTRLLLQGPADTFLRASDGSTLESESVQRALEEGRPSAWLERPVAAALGLKERKAAAGLAHVDAGPLGRWGVAVVTSAERVRDRELRASVRLTLGVVLTAGLVFLFGTMALRRQRTGLLLERELALEALNRKRDAELLTASRAATLGTLAMGIAHEVSTPLGVIAGRAEQLLAKVEGDERAARSVRAILEQAERIRRVVRAFLDVVRGGAPALGDAPPAVVLEGAASLVEHRFSAAGIAFETRVATDLPLIHGDVAMLQQALVNLLLNACDACSPGGHVTAAVDREGECVRFTVTDDGRGITPDEASRATEPFFTTKAPGHGSGLGLAITSEIVKLHRGKLALESASPCGTRASVSVPLPKVAARAA